MNITGITIENIKGIKRHHFKFTLYPNKPNILVAPNGFGKSSFAIAFASLHESKIILDEKDYHLGDGAFTPKIEISTSTGKCLSADNTMNDISGEFDVFVINNPLEPKANVRHYMGRTISKPTIDIKPTILVHTIPSKKDFIYRWVQLKRVFGINGKVLPDISFILCNGIIMAEIAALDLARIGRMKWGAKVNTYLNDINSQKGIAKIIRDYISKTVSAILKIGPYPAIADILVRHGIVSPNEDALKFLYVWQIWQLYINMGADFKKACKYVQYLDDKKRFAQEIEDFNPVKNRFNIVPKEKKEQLVVEWPKAHELSNGQRDILFFYAKLLEFERHKASKPQILIIDEIFDYLDDVNILLFQYKISTLVDSYRKAKKLIFPILVTHLDPNFFHHFCFNEDRINVCYLKKDNVKSNQELLNIIYVRENEAIKDKLDEAYFHFHPLYNTYNLTEEFRALGLNIEWANPSKFRKKVFRLLRTYLFENKDYDPIAVCWSVRLMIEEIIYSKIPSHAQQQEFIKTKKTKEKLKYAHRIGVFIPETYFLLGLIYNVSLHNSNVDTVQSVALKLNSLTVKNMIGQIVQEHVRLFGKQ